MVKNAPSPDELYMVQKRLPWIAAIAVFMQSLDGTILNTALPSIAKDMNRSPLSMQMVIVSYVLILALFIPVSGWLSDRYGSRRIFVWAIGIFTFGSLLCAIAPNLGSLIGARIVQAIGGSMMGPVARLAILYTFSKERLLGVINFIMIPGLVGPILGPTLGGWLVDIASWHWIFLINLPIGIAGIWYANKHMPNYIQEGKPFDTIGMLWFCGSLILLTIGIEFGSEDVLSAPLTIGIFAMGLLLMHFYYLHFKRVSNPLIDLNLIKIRTLRIGVFGNLVTRLGIGGMPMLLPLLFQVGFQHSAIVSGMMMIPSAITTIMVKPWVVPIVKKLGYRKTLLLNTSLIALIIAGFAFPNQNTPLPLLIPLLVLYGATNSIQLTSMNTLALSDLNNENASHGNSLLSVMQQLSISVGVSVGAFLLSKFQALPWVDHSNTVTVFRYTFVTMGIITLISGMVFLRLKESDGAELTGHK